MQGITHVKYKITTVPPKRQSSPMRCLSQLSPCLLHNLASLCTRQCTLSCWNQKVLEEQGRCHKRAPTNNQNIPSFCSQLPVSPCPSLDISSLHPPSFDCTVLFLWPTSVSLFPVLLFSFLYPPPACTIRSYLW